MERGMIIDNLNNILEVYDFDNVDVESVEGAVKLLRGYNVPNVECLETMVFVSNIIDDLLDVDVEVTNYDLAKLVHDQYVDDYDNLSTLRGDDEKYAYWKYVVNYEFNGIRKGHDYFEDRWHNGGSFMHNLCETLIKADYGNIAKIHKGFPEITDAYCCWSHGKHFKEFMLEGNYDEEGIKICEI